MAHHLESYGYIELPATHSQHAHYSARATKICHSMTFTPDVSEKSVSMLCRIGRECSLTSLQTCAQLSRDQISITTFLVSVSNGIFVLEFLVIGSNEISLIPFRISLVRNTIFGVVFAVFLHSPSHVF